MYRPPVDKIPVLDRSEVSTAPYEPIVQILEDVHPFLPKEGSQDSNYPCESSGGSGETEREDSELVHLSFHCEAEVFGVFWMYSYMEVSILEI